ncbi:HAD-IIA family hydrolase [Candidatus Poribacteria bacterium]|nr:HAD-IIA family hydrolase [Candidatus Poribacteria bacterium]
MKSYEGYIFDMDGVVYRGDKPIESAIKIINKLKSEGRKTMFITNNSAKLPGEYQSILLRIGVETVNETDIITAGNVAANYLKKQLKIKPEKNKVFCISEESVKQLIREIGMKVLDIKYHREADYVVVGFYKKFNWEMGSRAANAIATYGATFIGTNPDFARPVENGEIEAGTGSIIAFIESASSTEALLMGKPYPEMYVMAMERMNMVKSKILMVGDMLTTDIKGAIDFGMDSALVLTGMSTEKDIEKTGIRPNYIIRNLEEL